MVTVPPTPLPTTVVTTTVVPAAAVVALATLALDASNDAIAVTTPTSSVLSMMPYTTPWRASRSIP